MEQRLGTGTVVRSGDVNGNEVSGAALTPKGESYTFAALFTDDGEVVSLTLEET